MRLPVLIALIVMALVAAGCGGGEEGDAGTQPVPEEAQDTVQEGAEQVGAQDPDTLVRETQRVVQEVTASARQLHADPQVDVDDQLGGAEERARELAGQAEGAFGEEQAQVGTALREVNEQLADTAASLRDADARDQVQRIIDEDLARVGDQLRDASAEHAGELPEDLRRELDRGQTEVEELERSLSDAAGHD